MIRSQNTHNNNKNPTSRSGARWMLLLCLLLACSNCASAFVAPLFGSRHAVVGIDTRRPSLMPLYDTPVQQAEQEFLARSSDTTSQQPEIVYILLYNPGTTEEAVHTSSLGQEVLWAFEGIDDCMRFANLLKQEPPPQFNLAMDAEPIPTPAPLMQMETASRDMGLQLRIVPASM